MYLRAYVSQWYGLNTLDILNFNAIFLQDHVALDVTDKNGKTPLMLAVGREHHKIVTYLQMQVKSRASLMPKFDIW